MKQICGRAGTPRTLTVHILVSVVSGNLQHFTTFPRPHTEKRTEQIELTLPLRTIPRWRVLGKQLGLLGLGGFVCWALDAIISAGGIDRLAELVHKRPDLRGVIKWAIETNKPS